jgi:hypothetical protein
VQQHLGRLDGVSRAEVSLADGQVVVYPKEDSSLDPDRIFKATYDSGVSVTELSITASGRIERDSNGRLTFRISNRQVFEIVPNDLSKPFETMDAGEVSVRGLVFKKTGKNRPKTIAPLRLELLEVTPK